jgi:predicted nucleic acid-binding protein
MDERAGRTVAKELRVIGTAAIIGQAKKQGLIVSQGRLLKFCMPLIFVFQRRLSIRYWLVLMNRIARM